MRAIVLQCMFQETHGLHSSVRFTGKAQSLKAQLTHRQNPLHLIDQDRLRNLRKILSPKEPCQHRLYQFLVNHLNRTDKESVKSLPSMLYRQSM